MSIMRHRGFVFNGNWLGNCVRHASKCLMSVPVISVIIKYNVTIKDEICVLLT